MSLEKQRNNEMHNFDLDIGRIVFRHFEANPLAITRITVGTGNEVFRVQLLDRQIIIRLNKNPGVLKGSSFFIPLLRSRGVPVPEILYEDFSQTLIPFHYQVQTCMEGKDLGEVIDTLTDEQLAALAKSVVDIIQKMRAIPTNGKFGYFDGSETYLKSSWLEVMEELRNGILARNAQTKLLPCDLIEALQDITFDCAQKFQSVISVCYFDDMNAKNVMIDEGRCASLSDSSFMILLQ